MRYANGSSGNCEGPRMITVSFACGMGDDHYMVVPSTGNICIYTSIGKQGYRVMVSSASDYARTPEMPLSETPLKVPKRNKWIYI